MFSFIIVAAADPAATAWQESQKWLRWWGIYVPFYYFRPPTFTTRCFATFGFMAPVCGAVGISVVVPALEGTLLGQALASYSCWLHSQQSPFDHFQIFAGSKNKPEVKK